MSATLSLMSHALPLISMASVLIAAGIAPSVLGSVRSQASTKPSAPKKEKKKKKEKPDRHGFRGVPPPPTFSLADLPDDALLTETETASCLRVAKSTTTEWRQDPNHALKWKVLPGGFVRTTAGAVKAYISSGARRRKKNLSCLVLDSCRVAAAQCLLVGREAGRQRAAGQEMRRGDPVVGLSK